MDRRAAALGLALLAVFAVFAGATPPATAQTAQSPTVEVTVDSLPLDMGDVYHTAADPWMTVRATAPEGETVELVEVRVDGETRHVFEPSTRSVERNVVLDLANGPHRVTVVAQSGTVETHTATIVRDDQAPTVTFNDSLQGLPLSYRTDTLSRLGNSRPTFVVDGAPVVTLQNVPELTVSNSTLTVAGTIDDDSEIRSVRIDHTYEYAEVGDRVSADSGGPTFEYDPTEAAPIHSDLQTPTDDIDDDGDPERQDAYFMPSPGDSFNRTVTLALGTNYLRIAVEDSLGNIAVEHVAVTVEDETGPEVNVTDVRYVSPTRLRIEGTARDEVQVHDVWLEETLVTLDAIAADVELDALDGASLCTATNTLGLDNQEELCSVYDDATVHVREDANSLVVRHRLVFREPTVPDADRKQIAFDTTVYHPTGADEFVLASNDTALNDRRRTYELETFLAPNVTVDDNRTGYVDDRRVAVGGRVTDGQVGDVSVETVDPETGRTVDIHPVTLRSDGTFVTRLGAAADETQVRVRVRDASGVERLTNVTVAAPLNPPPRDANEGETAADSEADAGDEGAGDGTDSADASGGDSDSASSADGADGIEIPFVGVVVPVPGLGGVLGASVGVPVPFVGPLNVPLLGVGGLLVVIALVVVRRR